MGANDRGIFQPQPRAPRNNLDWKLPAQEDWPWYVRWYDQIGKVHRELAGSKKQAQALYHLRKADVIRQVKVPDLTKRELNLADLVKKYSEEFSAKKSAAHDERISGIWVELMGSYLLSHVTPGDIAKMKARWRREGFAGGTINRRTDYLKTLFNKAVRDRIIDYNPLSDKRVKREHENPDERPILMPEAESKLLAKLGRPHQLAVLLALHTGLRISEQVERKRTDVNLPARTLTIQDAKGKGRQKIFLDGVALSVISESLKSHNSPWLFPGELEHIRREAFSRKIQRVTKALAEECEEGSPERTMWETFTWHCFRHTYISRLVMLGVPIVTVQRLARHKSIQMTLKYAHLAPDHTWGALDQLAAAYPAPIPGLDSKTDSKDAL
jgi:integrase